MREFSLYVYTTISMCILLSLCTYYFLNVHTTFSMCIPLSLCVNYYFFACTTISMCILQFLCVNYYLYVYTIISLCILLSLCNFLSHHVNNTLSKVTISTTSPISLDHGCSSLLKLDGARLEIKNQYFKEHF